MCYRRERHDFSGKSRCSITVGRFPIRESRRGLNRAHPFVLAFSDILDGRKGIGTASARESRPARSAFYRVTKSFTKQSHSDPVSCIRRFNVEPKSVSSGRIVTSIRESSPLNIPRLCLIRREGPELQPAINLIRHSGTSNFFDVQLLFISPTRVQRGGITRHPRNCMELTAR
jgi:hypothetical protein